jgi:hypothetical protein
VGHAKNSTPLRAPADGGHDVLGPQRDVAWTPGVVPVENSWIWLFFLPVAGSLIGNFTRPLPLVMTFDISAL